MNVLGVDLSTRAVDMVKLPLDSDRAEWTRYKSAGKLAEDRLADLRGQLPSRGSAFWDDVCLVAIEWPSGKHRKVDTTLGAFLGFVVAHVPVRLVPWYFRPAEWRKECGLPGNATKDAVIEWVINYGPPHKDPSEKACARYGCFCCTWSPDAFDAYAVAAAARAVNGRADRTAA